MMRVLALFGILSACCLEISAQQMTPLMYIDTYQEAAMNNMRDKKVPASITLAQGILESGAGNSDLATMANNHFGIKCHDWKGETYFKDDDAPNECFRKYPTVQDSYADHANFLRNRPRYSKCFQLEITDYKGWARELKAAGYATLPTYADKLINTIEKYRLHDFDKLVAENSTPNSSNTAFDLNSNANLTNSPAVEPKPQSTTPSVNQKVTGPRGQPQNKNSAGYDRIVVETKVEESDDPTKLNRIRIQENPEEIPVGVMLVNGLNAVYAQKGDTRLTMALRYGLAEWQIRRYNDMHEDQEPREGDIIFLEPKLDACHVCHEHTVAGGEDLWELAQKYGVKLNSLKQLNGLGSGVPESGTVLKLK